MGLERKNLVIRGEKKSDEEGSSGKNAEKSSRLRW